MIKRAYHGMVGTRVYNTWRGMIERCENPNHKAYQRYGGRGIKVCRRWRQGFPAFLKDMGEPKPGESIERRRNSRDYSPANCYWATRKQQGRNKRNNRLITADGVTRTLAEWAELTGINFVTIISRIDRDGLSPEVALTAGNRPKKTTRWIEYKGERLSLTDCARRLGMARSSLLVRIKRWGIEQALAEPKRPGSSKPTLPAGCSPPTT